MADERKSLTIKEAAEWLNVSDQFVRNEIKRKNLRGMKIGPGKGMYRIRPEDLEEYHNGGTGVAAAVEEQFGDYEGRPGEFDDE